MSTEPIEKILPEYWGEEVELKETLKDFSDLISECVYYGTHIHEWVHKSFEGEKDYPLPILFLLRHTLEIGLAISELVKQSLIDPGKVQARALFESQLYIKYLTEKNFKKRSFAFLVTHYINRQVLHDRLNPKKEIGKQFKTEMKGTILEDIEIHEDVDLDKASESLDQLFKKAGFNEAYEEYYRVKDKFDKSHRSMSFYSLYEEIMNTKELSESLDMGEYYQINYRYWSKKVHASDILTGYLDSDESGNQYFIALKDPSHAQAITFYTVHYLTGVFRELISKFINERIPYYNIWYKENIEQKYNELAKRRIININKG